MTFNHKVNMDSVVEAAEEHSEEPSEDANEAPSLTNTSAEGVSDDELEELLEEQTTDITVIGCGGAGCNTTTRMVNEGIEGAEIVAANTDVQHLLKRTDTNTKILLGKNKTKGRGAGSVPKIGEEAALETEDQIRDSLEGSDMVFVTAGMGGGTGTGAAPVVARIAQEEGALTISVVTTPFTAEGEPRMNNAEAGLSKLREQSDTVIVVPNDKLLDTVGTMPVNKAFKVSDEILMRSVKGITELITSSGLVNLDFADVETTMENGDVALIGLGESDSNNRATDSVKSALRSPLLDLDISNANSVLVNVTGGNDMSIEEAEGVVEHIHEKVNEDARIIWGTSIDPDLGEKIRTMLVVTGVDSPQIFGDNPPTPSNPRSIDYVD